MLSILTSHHSGRWRKCGLLLLDSKVRKILSMTIQCTADVGIDLGSCTVSWWTKYFLWALLHFSIAFVSCSLRPYKAYVHEPNGIQSYIALNEDIVMIGSDYTAVGWGSLTLQTRRLTVVCIDLKPKQYEFKWFNSTLSRHRNFSEVVSHFGKKCIKQSD
jgi:hypothetical protein